MSDNPYEPPEEKGIDPPRKNRLLTCLGTFLAVLFILGLLIVLLLPMRRSARPAAFRSQCANNLKQIALALHAYEETYQSFPPAYTTDSEGRPLHSWRALILPFVEFQATFDSIDSIDFSKPWDDPANAKAYETTPYAFRCPSNDASPGFTTYMAIVAPDGCFHPTRARQLSEITDSHAETLMLIEVSPDKAVHWMAPRDAGAQFFLDFDLQSKTAHSGGVNAAFVDGSIRFLSADISKSDRRAAITIAGNDRLGNADAKVDGE